MQKPKAVNKYLQTFFASFEGKRIIYGHAKTLLLVGLNLIGTKKKSASTHAVYTDHHIEIYVYSQVSQGRAMRCQARPNK
ncbi:hypothetical protein HanRHA438_Chr08g0339521 [Helianthus annuus]|nr:hypothetical protein HanIR_Chr08g0354511 [Helianthus annuus]KAJ0896882.1 hypothetical protein HanRHA438_Chr08g0339521 [Helianthus annuus]